MPKTVKYSQYLKTDQMGGNGGMVCLFLDHLGFHQTSFSKIIKQIQKNAPPLSTMCQASFWLPKELQLGSLKDLWNLLKSYKRPPIIL